MQWATIIFTVIGFIYNGYVNIHQLTPVQYQQPQAYIKPQTQMPVMRWQVAFDPNTGKFYHQHGDGNWYEQPPQYSQYVQAVVTSNNNANPLRTY